MNKNIRIVGTDASPLQIIDNGEESYLVRNEGNSSTIITETTSSPIRPIHCSELSKKIEARRWHKFDTKVIGDDGRLYSRFYEIVEPYDEIDSINLNTANVDRNRYFQLNENKGPLGKYDNEDDIEELYSKLFGNMDEANIPFYSLHKKVINVVDRSIPIDIIRADSSEYTDTVSLSEVMDFSLAPVGSCKVDLVVNYSKNNNIYSRQISFTAFNYDGDSIKVENLIEKINNDVQVEYIEKVIKVTPINTLVDECIINRCTLLYGRN